MKSIYEKPVVNLSDVITDCLICASGEPKCYIDPENATKVSPFTFVESNEEINVEL